MRTHLFAGCFIAIVLSSSLRTTGNTMCVKQHSAPGFYNGHPKATRGFAEIPPANINITQVSKELLEVITGVKEPRSDLQLNNFVFSPVSAQHKYQLNFELPEKGSISIKILDASFQELFKDKMCEFDHKYSKSLPLAEKDTYYISVNFNDDWFVRKIVMD